MRRSWRLAVALPALLALLGCLGPCADLVDESVQDTPVEFNVCCQNAGVDRLAALTGVQPVTVADGVLTGETRGIRVEATAVTRALHIDKRDFDGDTDGMVALDDAHEYVAVLVSRVPDQAAATHPWRDQHGIAVYATPAQAWPQPRWEGTPRLVDASNGKDVRSKIIVLRVPVGATVVYTLDLHRRLPDRPAVDLRTGARGVYPAKPGQDRP
ncbi:hypothetical protein KZZ52_39745 [Dactylosporangium sp. AC04546]|uniref:hypothetical protein n=1 Tax=Dactylosporangium sp. AC04546 TaxID=2862460 RepID=UPI001EDD8BDC|nr:hypothetical protein [Dactylosporangium sp. AC04546]WVK80083.1 hypothetical protein KZZ52_39745 [Dactylosporangium sp. AC04546]